MITTAAPSRAIAAANLCTTKNAQFFRLENAVDDDLIENLFDFVCPNDTDVCARQVRAAARVDGVDSIYSLLVFRFQEEPAFLKASRLQEIRYGYLLVVELASIVAVFRKRAPAIVKRLKGYAKPLDYGTVTKLYEGSDTQYERIALKNMTISEHALRSWVLEARDLRTAITTVGTHRAIPRSLRLMRYGGERMSLSPGNSRIRQLEKRRSFDDLIRWCRAVEKTLLAFGPTEGFMDHFARPCSLSELPAGLEVTGLLLNLERLEAAIQKGTRRLMVVFNRRTNTTRALTDDAVQRIFEAARQTFVVGSEDGEEVIRRPNGVMLGYVRRNKQSITLRSRRLARILIEDPDSGEAVSLLAYINQEQKFILSFARPEYVYFAKQLFRDDRLLGDMAGFKNIFVPRIVRGSISSEKGAFARSSTRFEVGSLFRLIEDELVPAREALACDDLGDEWADYIAIAGDDSEPTLTFYHAKHGDLGLSASGFQEVVAQALKNLANLQPEMRALDRKRAKWARAYANEGKKTRIRRLRGGLSPKMFIRDFKRVVGAANSVRKVGLVVSFLSKKEFFGELAKLRRQQSVRPNVTQLLWILSVYVSACRLAGAIPQIFCVA